jgi:chemotaxis protein MotA
MLPQLGITITILSLLIGFLGSGGNGYILFQPFELLIILGTAAGSFIISNPLNLIQSIYKNLPKIGKKSAHNKEDYLELMVFLFNFFKFARTHPIIDIESHIEYPEKSELFTNFDKIFNNKPAITFICDYMRMQVLGFDNAFEMEQMMDEDITQKRNSCNDISYSIQHLGDALPALGILAAVLGIINAMGAISSDAVILGHKIAGALIGTFLGIFFSYAIVTPIGIYLGKFMADEIKFLECMKVGILAHVKGYPPTIAIEFARQAIPVEMKPSFDEIEESIRVYMIKGVMK